MIMRRWIAVFLATALATAAAVSAGVAGAGESDTDSTGSDSTGSEQSPDGGEGHYQQFDDARGFLNILPPGQDANLDAEEFAQARAADEAGDENGFPPYFADQRIMYNDLVFNAPGLTDDQLLDYFKDASFGVAPDDIGRTYQPGERSDVTVIRDESFNVPHIFGDTREGTMFAQGYATAEDRMLYMDVLRNAGRGRLSAFVGFSDALIGQDLDAIENAPYTEADLQAQVDELLQGDADDKAVYDDIVAYAQGVNAFIADAEEDETLLPAEYGLLGKTPEPWAPTDAVAIGALIGGIFGKGGGREVQNYCGLETMSETLGADEARAVYDDLKFANDPAAPVSSTQSAPYNDDLGSTNEAAVPDLDCDSLVPVGGGDPESAQPVPAAEGAGVDAAGEASLSPAVPDSIISFLGRLSDAAEQPSSASNAILVNGEHTDDGRPIAVFGPQIGYSVPELIVEKDVHGPGIDARGMGFLGIDMWVLIGRGQDYAWSATSSGADNIDQFVLTLCDPGGGEATLESMGYEHDGECKEIETYDHVVETTDGLIVGDPVTLTWKIQRAPDYGPINQRGTLKDGTPIAVANDRSTYFQELASSIGFRNVNDPGYMEEGYEAFRRAMGEGITFSFNWFYVDAENAGYQHSCKCPNRAEGVDPSLPTTGTGEFDWNGFLDAEDQPHDADPGRGYVTSWNNKQAPEFTSADDQWSFGPIYRVDLLNSRIQEGIDGGEKFDRAAVADLMEDAATVDLRAQEILPVLLEIMGLTPPEGRDDRLAAMREELELWLEFDGHRRAREKGDPDYETPVGPAIMDAWWEPLTYTIFNKENSGDAFQSLDLSIHNSPGNHQGSSFSQGSYSHLYNDLTKVAGEPTAGAWERSYCGNGDLEACRKALWDSLEETIPRLEFEFQDSADPTDVSSWRRVVADDQIEYSALIVGVPPMNWVNRPTFQQVVQLETDGRAELRTTESSGSESDGSSSNVGVFVLIIIGALIVISLVVMIRRARRRSGT